MEEAASGLVVDSMLGSLARKLRAFGFDALYYAEGTDAGILGLSKRQRRIIVTADRGLAEASRRADLPVLLVSGRTDGRRLSALLEIAKTEKIRLEPGEPLCSVCNGRLVRVKRGEAERFIPGSVAARHRAFHRCVTCGKVYWRGSHWKKLRRLEKLFRPKRRQEV